MTASLVWGFTLAALLAYVIPGPDWFVVLRHATRSPTAGLRAALGVQCGLVVHVTAAALGVSAVLAASAELFTLVKLAGGAYLIFLGVQALRDATRSLRQHSECAATDAFPESASTGTSSSTSAAARSLEAPPSRVWRQAFTANVLNAKAALFFVAVLPQFLSTTAPTTPQIVALGIVDIATGCVWWALFVAVATRLRGFLGRPWRRFALDTTAGLALFGLGGALAVTARGPA
ncbi:LysE family translocator [Nocardia takedensis]